MAFKDIRQYISTLEKYDEVKKISREVHWNAEAGAILRRVYELGLPAPFFQKIKGYPDGYRILGGPIGSLRRVAITMGLKPETPHRQLMEEYFKRKGRLIKPILVKDGPCKENILIGDKVDLFKFPAPMVHEGDGGRYIATWHANISKDPDTGWTNWGMYRAMICSKNIMTGRVEPNKHMGMHLYRKYQPANKPMPFAIAIGIDPVCGMMACTPMSPQLAEADVAGALRGEPVELVKCETVDLEVPATSEIVIEGVVDPHETLYEGPFGEYTGYRASPRDKRPMYRVTAITHRDDPILTMSCMGVPIDDCHAAMSVTLGAEYLDILKRQGYPVIDLCVYPECATLMVAVSVKVPYANIAQAIATAIWGSDQGYCSPYVIVLEDDVDPRNLSHVLHAIATKCHPWRGITKMEHARATQLYPFLSLYERRHRLGSHVYFDCTWPVDWDPAIAVPPRSSFDNIYSRETQQHVLKNWKKYGYD